MAITGASGIPVAPDIESVSPHEVKLVEKTIESGFTRYVPEKIIGDKPTTALPMIIASLMREALK